VTIGRALAAIALVFGLLAAVAGTPRPPVRGIIDVDATALMIVKEQDHVDAADLGAWIRDRKPGLRVIDVRSAAEFDAYHVPAAENLPLERITRTTFAPADTVVLYSQGGAHAAQAWVLLRAIGLPHVYFLSGGLDEWLTDVMDPVLPEDATPAEKSAFASIADVSRYFGGTPHIGPRQTGGRSAAAAGEILTKLKRRGC